MTKPLLFLLLLGLGYACTPDGSQSSPTNNNKTLQTWPDNPEYWSWDGENPTLLLGGSNFTAPFLEDEALEELNYLIKAGGNYVRFAMPVTTTAGHHPFVMAEDGSEKEIASLDSPYWKKLVAYLNNANTLGVAVEIMVWDHANFRSDNWDENAWTAPGGMADSILPRAFVAGEHPFFQTVTGAAAFKPAYEALWATQRAFVDNLFAVAYRYPNVIFNVRVPSPLEIPWMVYWGRYLEAKAAAADDRYPARKINLNIGVEPISAISVASFNRKLMGGANAAFHRPPPNGNGLNGAAQASIRGVRVVAQHLKFWNLRPAPDFLLDDDTEARAATDGQGNYLVYLPRAGAVNLVPDWAEQVPVRVTVVGYLGTQRSELLEPPYGDSFRLYTEEERGGWMILQPQ